MHFSASQVRVVDLCLTLELRLRAQMFVNTCGAAEASSCIALLAQCLTARPPGKGQESFYLQCLTPCMTALCGAALPKFGPSHSARLRGWLVPQDVALGDRGRSGGAGLFNLLTLPRLCLGLCASCGKKAFALRRRPVAWLGGGS